WLSMWGCTPNYLAWSWKQTFSLPPKSGVCVKIGCRALAALNSETRSARSRRAPGPGPSPRPRHAAQQPPKQGDERAHLNDEPDQEEGDHEHPPRDGRVPHEQVQDERGDGQNADTHERHRCRRGGLEAPSHEHDAGHAHPCDDPGTLDAFDDG